MSSMRPRSYFTRALGGKRNSGAQKVGMGDLRQEKGNARGCWFGSEGMLSKTSSSEDVAG
jgi:hypothetical protein